MTLFLDNYKNALNDIKCYLQTDLAPVCLHKHLKYQFNNILQLNTEEQQILFFNKNQDIYKSASEFINLSKKYYINYNKEKTLEDIKSHKKQQNKDFINTLLIKGNEYDIK